MTNYVDRDQTAHKQLDIGLHCSLQHVLDIHLITIVLPIMAYTIILFSESINKFLDFACIISKISENNSKMAYWFQPRFCMET